MLIGRQRIAERIVLRVETAIQGETEPRRDVKLNGWHRLGIVIADAWALAVIGLATLEYQAGQGQAGDGFFTCWEPDGSPTPPATRHWNRDCGLFPGTWAAADIDSLFDDIPRVGIPSYRRYLNIPRFSAILLGPGIFIALVIFAVCWIARGFRSSGPETDHSEPNAACRPLLSAQPELPPQSHTEAWLHRLPRRWARNAAITGGLSVPLFMLSSLNQSNGSSDNMFVVLMLISVGIAMLSTAGTWYLCGLWARYSLKGPLLLSPASALNRIMPNWLTGAILPAALAFSFDAVLGTSAISRNWGHLIGRFAGAILIGYLIALVSRRGLRKAIDADRKPSSARPGRPLAPHGDPLQREYSIG